MEYELIEKCKLKEDTVYSAKLYVGDEQIINISDFCYVDLFAKTCIFLESFTSEFLDYFCDDFDNGNTEKGAHVLDAMSDNCDIVDYCKKEFGIDTSDHFMRLLFRELNMIIVDYWDGRSYTNLADVTSVCGDIVKNYELKTKFKLPEDFMKTIIKFVYGKDE